MQNEIEKIREDINRFFEPGNVVPESDKETNSPDGRYFVRSCSYRQADPTRNWVVSKIDLYRRSDGKMLFGFIRNEDFIPSAWLSRNGADYFLCPEDFEGQSVYDISNEVLYSFTSREDPFIWVEIVPSPDQTRLAVIGCFWACPWELVIYDISRVCELPYPVITRITLQEETLKGWKDDHTVVFEDGGKEVTYSIDQ